MKKIVIIGGGPGGYVAAIRAAQLGAEVHVVEATYFGGTCLNVGCIPTKALIQGAETYSAIRNAGRLGISAEKVDLNWGELLKFKQQTVQRLVQGVEGLLKANGVTCHRGKGTLKDLHTVFVQGERESYEIKADVILLATGSANFAPPVLDMSLEGMLTSTEALSLQEIPKTMLIVGGGVIGIEFAYLYSALGTKVTVVELLPEILPMMDTELVGILKEELARQGVVFCTETNLQEVKKANGGLIASISEKGKAKTVNAEKILVAIGRRACIQGLGLEELGIGIHRGAIQVNNFFQTNFPNIYAIGDCNGQMMLAHAASAQGIAAVEHALGETPSYFAQTIPSCLYTHPEVASVGLSEKEAKQKGIPVRIATFPLGGNGKALIENGGVGLFKMVVGEKYQEVLGVQMIGPRATDLIAEASLALRLEATVDELISTIHGHPTLSEAMGEVAMAAESGAIHWPPKK